jgi:hypothetical protein
MFPCIPGCWNLLKYTFYYIMRIFKPPSMKIVFISCLNKPHEQKVHTVAAIRKFEHGVRDLPVGGVVLSGGNMDTIITVQSSVYLWCLHVNSAYIGTWGGGGLCAALHPKRRVLHAVIAHILYTPAARKRTPSTSRADLRPVHRRSYSTAATLPYTLFMFHIPFQLLRAFRVTYLRNESKPAETCKRSKRLARPITAVQCRLSATALNFIKVTAQLNSRVKPTLSLYMTSRRQF